MLATKISFMNEMANLAERLGADIEMVRTGIGSDPRIGYHFIYPGRRLRRLLLPQGREGADPRRAASVGFEPQLLRRGRGAQRRAEAACSSTRSQRHFGGDSQGRTFAALGPGLQAQHRRHARGAAPRADGGAAGTPAPKVQAYDPEAMEEAQRIYGDRDDLDALRHQGGGAARAPTRWSS